MQRFTPMLAYADAAAALEFLAKAFGFTERFRMDMPDGSVGHAEVGLGDEVVMVSSEWAVGGVAADQEYGMRSYRAIDHEGQRWIFAGPLAGETR